MKNIILTKAQLCFSLSMVLFAVVLVVDTKLRTKQMTTDFLVGKYKEYNRFNHYEEDEE